MAGSFSDAAERDVVLGERYRLGRRIAVGGMGEVWRAEDTLLHRPVAVKVLKTEFSQDPTFLGRFRNEARSAASFTHSGIAGVFDYGETADAAYLVMELVQGEPLSAILAREYRLGYDRTLDYVGQAAAALEVAHRAGMVHRDIKPGNLLVTARGEVKITDFGVARAASAVRLTTAGMVVGTAQYFSPEQAEGRAVGPASDVYSLGVLAYECLAGILPFTADSPITVAMMHIRNLPPPLPQDVPPPVRAVVERAMAKDPALRYPTGGAMASAVRAAREGRIAPPPMGPPPARMFVPPPLDGPPPRGRGRAALIAIGVFVVVAAAAAAIVLLVAHHRDKPSGTPSTLPTGRPATGPAAAGSVRSLMPASGHPAATSGLTIEGVR